MEVVLVTGAAGFIGSHLCERLISLGYKVIGIDNFDPFYDRCIKERNISGIINDDNFELIDGDLCDDNTYRRISNTPVIIIHLAGKAGVLPSLKDPKGYVTSNILATQNVLDYMKGSKVKKLLFASSSSVYGNNTKFPFEETDPVDHPISPYAFTKKACELIIHTYHHLYDIDALCLRFFTVYGPRQRPDLAIHKFFTLIKQDLPIEMYGDGDSARDYTFIVDTLNGIMGAIDFIINNTNCYEIVNLGNNHPIKLRDLITSIYSICNAYPNVIRKPMQPGDVNITFADISKAKALFNYNPTYKLENGLKAFLNWHESFE